METIEIKCSTCNGAGVIQVAGDNGTETKVCLACGGHGRLNTASIDNTEALEMLRWLKKKVKVLLKNSNLPED